MCKLIAQLLLFLLTIYSGTPDRWIPRDSRLVRLTGKHPFNAEAKLNDLFFQGFFTPSSLFFVRNHGAVPQVDSKMAYEWKVQLHGYVFYV